MHPYPTTHRSSRHHLDQTMHDASPFLPFADDSQPRDHNPFDNADNLFAMDVESAPAWDYATSHHHHQQLSSDSPASPSSQLDYPPFGHDLSPASYPGPHSFDPTYGSGEFDNSYLNHWLHVEDDGGQSAPIAIPAALDFASHNGQSSPSFVAAAYDDALFYNPKPESFSPPGIDYTLHSFSQPHSLDNDQPFAASVSPPELSQPSWATSLFAPPSSAPRPVTSPGPQLLHPPSPLLADDNTATQRPRNRRVSMPAASNIFHPSSAPSGIRVPSRPYSRRAESASTGDDPDATVRRKRKVELSEDGLSDAASDRARPTSETPPQKSHLHPPKLAPSAWQLYFTDWIQRHQATSTRKLNVAQAAKEAGAEYAALSAAEKEPYQRRSQHAKEAREREYTKYMSSLSPDDIKRENVFRQAQRKAGKSRKGNIKDPNAPKKPLSAYFMFLQRIRSDPALVQDVFGDETETTKQSVLAAGKWRSMTDDEKRPFLAQAEQEKLEYEAARKRYEEGAAAPDYGTSISFSVLPGNLFQTSHIPLSSSPAGKVKAEPMSSESESEADSFSFSVSASASASGSERKFRSRA